MRRVRRALGFVSPGGNGTAAARSARRSLASRRMGFVETGWGPASDMAARYLRANTENTECWGWRTVPQVSMIESMPFIGPVSRSHQLVAAAVAFAAVFVLALVIDDPRQAVTVLYVLPIALCALATGIRGGLVAAGVASGLVVVW